MRRPAHFAISGTFQHATKMIDKAPVSVEKSPYKMSDLRETMDFDTNTLGRVEREGPSSVDESTLESIRRWQQSRLQTKDTVRTAQHIVGVTERMRLTGTQTVTDPMLDQSAATLRLRQQQEYEDYQYLEAVRKKREGYKTLTQMFQAREDVAVDEEVLNLPKRIMEAQREAFEESRAKELAMAVGTPASEGGPHDLELQKAGNLTVTRLSRLPRSPTSPRPYKPLKPSRLLIKQLAPTVPHAQPFMEEPTTENLPIFRPTSTEGAIIPSSTPACSHTISGHAISHSAVGLMTSGSHLTTEMVANAMRNDEDLLLASHIAYGNGGALRHPNAENLNREVVAKPAQKPTVQAAIEGDDLPTQEEASVDTSKMTKLEYQRYLDVVESQRQADIASALTKAKNYQRDQQRSQRYQGADSRQAFHNKFAQGGDEGLKAQHEYLTKLLSKDPLGNQGDDGIASASGNNGVQWIGTTPRMFTSKVHAFTIRVMGSAALIGVLIYLNPSVLDEPAPSKYVEPSFKPLF